MLLLSAFWSVVILCVVAFVACCPGVVVTLIACGLFGVEREADEAPEIMPPSGAAAAVAVTGSSATTPVAQARPARSYAILPEDVSESEHSHLLRAEWNVTREETLKIPAALLRLPDHPGHRRQPLHPPVPLNIPWRPYTTPERQ
jgi:hypothetical protein